MPAQTLRHRPAAVAGQFYASDPQELRAQIRGWLGCAAQPAIGSSPKLLIVPHAGYSYSGAIAAKAYELLASCRPRIRRVILLGPAHRVAVKGIAIPTADAFDTPLGVVPLDRVALNLNADLPQVIANDLAHLHEHALEVQLPFLQEGLENFSLVPLVVGFATPDEVAEVLERLWGGEETLIVISTDLSHFLSYEQAVKRDQRTLQKLMSLDAAIVPEEACGATPVNGALKAAARHGLKAELLARCNSGDVTGDHARVVGYAALAFWSDSRLGIKDFTPGQESAEVDADSEVLGRALLARARNVIARRLGYPLLEEPHHPDLHLPGASFVTLHHEGRLRGCIGRLEAGDHTLEMDVRDNALRAAFQDPRFKPVSNHEWPHINLEVSLLESPQALKFESEHHALAQLTAGLDGVIFSWRHHQSTFLPQVWEQLPTVGAFMAALKRKAGLPESFWADDVQLACYRVRVFREFESADALMSQCLSRPEIA